MTSYLDWQHIMLTHHSRYSLQIFHSPFKIIIASDWSDLRNLTTTMKFTEESHTTIEQGTAGL